MSMLVLSVSAQKTHTIKKFVHAVPELAAEVSPVWDQVEARSDFESTGGNFQSCSWRLAWNDTAFFYILEVVQDPIRPMFVTKLSDWQSDRGEIFFNVGAEPNVDLGAMSDGWQAGRYQFVTVFGGSADALGPNDSIAYNSLQWPDAKGPFHFAFTMDYDLGEWTYMGIVPFSTLTSEFVDNVKTNPFVGAAGKKIGFEVQITGNTPDFKRWFNNWSAPSMLEGTAGIIETWATFKHAGVITLSADAVPAPVSAPSVATKVINVYPNPAVSVVNVELSRNADITISNINGSIVSVIRNSNGRNIDVSSLPRGMYIIRANNYVGRFAKQ